MKLSDTECQKLSAYIALHRNKLISLTGGTNMLSMPPECGCSCVGATGRLLAVLFRNHIRNTVIYGNTI